MANKYETPEGVRTHDYTVLEDFDADGFPSNLDEVIELLKAWRARYPGDTVELEISRGRYDGDCPEIQLTAWVPRPPEEVDVDQNRVARRKQNEVIRREQEERHQLRVLVAKYGVPNA